jgi:hypothetical protein
MNHLGVMCAKGIEFSSREELDERDNIPPETTCGYCTQGKHNECRGYDCACAKNGHP